MNIKKGILTAIVFSTLASSNAFACLVSGCPPARTPTPPPAVKPDLIPTAVRMDAPYLYVDVKNIGGRNLSDSQFTVRVTNVATGATFETNSLYPFNVPPPGGSMETGGITRGLIGLTNCTTATIKVMVDDSNQIAESNEANNTATYTVNCPSSVGPVVTPVPIPNPAK